MFLYTEALQIHAVYLKQGLHFEIKNRTDEPHFITVGAEIKEQGNVGDEVNPKRALHIPLYNLTSISDYLSIAGVACIHLHQHIEAQHTCS